MSIENNQRFATDIIRNILLIKLSWKAYSDEKLEQIKKNIGTSAASNTRVSRVSIKMRAMLVAFIEDRSESNRLLAIIRGSSSGTITKIIAI